MALMGVLLQLASEMQTPAGGLHHDAGQGTALCELANALFDDSNHLSQACVDVHRDVPGYLEGVENHVKREWIS